MQEQEQMDLQKTRKVHLRLGITRERADEGHEA